MTTAMETLETLIIKAARDGTFCEALIHSPAEAAKSEGVELDADGLAILQRIAPDLKRFGGKSSLDPDDALIWAAGLLLTRVLRPDAQKWQVRVTSIMRNHPPF